MPAEDAKNLLVGEVENGVGAVLGANGGLLEKRRSPAHAHVVGGAAVFPHAEGGAGLEVDGAAQGIRAFVGRLAFDEFKAFEHGARDGLKLEAAVGAEAREGAAVDGDVVERRVHAADVEAVGEAFIGGAAGDAGETLDDFAGTHVGQVAEGIHGDDVLHVGGVALFGDHGGIAFAFAGDLERLKFVDAGGEFEIAGDRLRGAHDQAAARGIEPDVGDDEFVGALGDAGERVAAGVVGERGEIERGDGDEGAGELVARGRVADSAGDGAACSGFSGGGDAKLE